MITPSDAYWDLRCEHEKVRLHIYIEELFFRERLWEFIHSGVIVRKNPQPLPIPYPPIYLTPTI